jgi:membrane-associated phospholipid phosphatase
MSMSRPRFLWAFWAAALFFGLVAGAGILVLDGPIADWSARQEPAVWNRGTAILDLLVLKEVSNFLLGPILMLAAGLLIVFRSRALGWPLLYVGAVQFSSTVIADLAKPQIGRLRPHEVLAGAGDIDNWFVGANSFPSGHAAFYAGLFFPLMLLFPRWSLLLVLPPAFVAAARVVSHDHYLSDVAASLALAALMTIAFSFILRRTDARA